MVTRAPIRVKAADRNKTFRMRIVPVREGRYLSVSHVIVSAEGAEGEVSGRIVTLEWPRLRWIISAHIPRWQR